MQPWLNWLTWLSDQKLSQGTESKGDTSPSLCLGYSHNLSVNLLNPDPPTLSVSLSCELGSRNSQDAKSKPSHLRFCDWRLHRHKGRSSIKFLKFIYNHQLNMKHMINMTREIINIVDVICYHQHEIVVMFCHAYSLPSSHVLTRISVIFKDSTLTSMCLA